MPGQSHLFPFYQIFQERTTFLQKRNDAAYSASNTNGTKWSPSHQQNQMRRQRQEPCDQMEWNNPGLECEQSEKRPNTYQWTSFILLPCLTAHAQKSRTLVLVSATLSQTSSTLGMDTPTGRECVLRRKNFANAVPFTGFSFHHYPCIKLQILHFALCGFRCGALVVSEFLLFGR